jgi:ketosteroid isomerase-like protein
LADDLVWVATGSSPVAGTYKGKQVYLEKIIKRLGDRLQSWPKPVVENADTRGARFRSQFGADERRDCGVRSKYAFGIR